jgi:hypothetical protein
VDGRELYNLNAQLQHRRRAAAEAELARLKADAEAELERQRADAEAARDRMARLLGSAAALPDGKTAERQDLQAAAAAKARRERQRAAAEAERERKLPLWMPQLPPLLGYEEAERGRQRAAAEAELERQRAAEKAERERKRADWERQWAAEKAERERKAEAERRRHDMATIDRMTGIEFEDFVEDRFRREGWDVRRTPATRDYGVDLIAVRGRWFAVQCKRSATPVSLEAVQQVVAGAPKYNCKAIMVVSNQEFTEAAKTLADIHNCVLIGRRDLLKMPWVD